MVNVEADAVAGPPLARRASEAGLVYSLAYGDQPALICELVDWARTAGFTVVCVGKGTRYLPEYHVSTPETVWHHYGFTAEQSAGRLRTPAMTQHPGERPAEAASRARPCSAHRLARTIPARPPPTARSTDASIPAFRVYSDRLTSSW